MNVKTATKELNTSSGADGRKMIRRILVANNDFEAGDVIYKARTLQQHVQSDILSRRHR